MKWLLNGLIGVVAISLAVSALLIGSAMIFGTPIDQAVVHIDDAGYTLGDLTSTHWVFAFMGLALACIVVVIVVPLAVLLPVAFAVIATVIALAFAAAVVAAVCSPLLLLGWIVWRLVRKPAATTPAATALAR